MKRRKGLFLFICLIVLCLFFTAAIAGDIAIDGASFPDEALRSAVASFDEDGDGVLSDGEAAQAEELSRAGAADLKGIEYLPGLKILRSNGGGLSGIDLSHNPELEEIDLNRNALTSIDVSQNPKLKKLVVSRNNLASLDISTNHELEVLYCSYNTLAELDVSRNPLLKDLVCSDNSLKALDLSQNNLIQWLNCERNQLREIILPPVSMIRSLLCGSNQLTSLDVSNHFLLNELFLTGIEPDIRNDYWTGKEQAYRCGDIEPDMDDLGILPTDFGYGEDQGAVYTVFCTIDTDVEIYTRAISMDVGQVRNFVANCYSAALGREASEEEITNWTALIVAGQKKAKQAAREFILSEEFRNRGLSNEETIRTLYLLYFQREPDPFGLALWIAQLNNGEKLETVMEEFAHSQEFKNIIDAMKQ